MTAGELIELLQAWHPERRVVMDIPDAATETVRVVEIADYYFDQVDEVIHLIPPEED
jgi:hypothetical protein